MRSSTTLSATLAVGLGALLAAAQDAAANASNSTAVTCVTGAHIIVARGSYEAQNATDPGFGILGTVKDELLQKINESDAVALRYPATIFPPDTLYVDSVPQGVGNLTELITAYVDKCKTGKLVLMGYSQGAQVIGDTLIGADYEKFDAFPPTDPLDDKYLARVGAVILMGDPSNVDGVPFGVGNSTHSGVFGRNNTDAWNTTGLERRVQAYCDAGDRFCDSGNSLGVHSSYVRRYGQQAVGFVEDWVEKNGTGLPPSSASGAGPVNNTEEASPSGTEDGGASETSEAAASASSDESAAGRAYYSVGAVMAGLLAVALCL